MKEKVPLFITVLFLVGCYIPSTPKEPQRERELIEFTGIVENDISNFLLDTVAVAYVMDGLEENPRLRELSEKFKKGIQENQEWYWNQLKNISEGEPVPYDPKIGMPKEEYEELSRLRRNIKAVATRTEFLQIFRKDTLITFKGTGNIQALDKIEIDLKNNVIRYKDYRLIFDGVTTVNDTTNVYKSKWMGYRWIFEYPTDVEISDIPGIYNLELKQVQFTIGQMEKRGSIYLLLKERVMREGEMIEDLNLPILF